MAQISAPGGVTRFSAPPSNQDVVVPQNQALDQGDFLRLLTTQVQNQDPTQPLDPNQFVNQLTQFSTLQGITQLNESANTLNQAVAGNMATRASGMLGQRALVPSDMAVLESDGGLRGAVSVPPGAKGPIQVQILDDSGHEVSHLTVQAENGSGNQETMVPFSWDGKGPRGRAMTPGTYHIAATANGQALTTYGSARVQSVALGSSDAQTMVDLGALGQMPISDIRQLTL